MFCFFLLLLLYVFIFLRHRREEEEEEEEEKKPTTLHDPAKLECVVNRNSNHISFVFHVDNAWSWTKINDKK
jgi:Ca2+/Na+ antiporter